MFGDDDDDDDYTMASSSLSLLLLLLSLSLNACTCVLHSQLSSLYITNVKCITVASCSRLRTATIDPPLV